MIAHEPDETELGWLALEAGIEARRHGRRCPLCERSGGLSCPAGQRLAAAAIDAQRRHSRALVASTL